MNKWHVKHQAVAAWPLHQHRLGKVAHEARGARQLEVADAAGKDAGLGDRVPSEVQLCERYGVSPMTARRALIQLLAGRIAAGRLPALLSP